ncbi:MULTISPECIES: hypothetical protein [Agrobacterium tumefaciens complex]|jgi:phenylpyruvate tautomerase PptA (4-oxalocrotonate tautomerase family)|uniref:hypothetical protein n=1 Tax=Agrobacterium tumefaciens complex TaxID=1183400 RepID=UPI000DDA15B3|nr:MULTISPECIES: hypothetical protein [Agrobacterium tumefaciens complex]MBB4405400.1 phenylpyruvate tautomerase PptA (4-oxalocrotonate tautomerase family) [Agrobacterium radiobacter]MBB4451192.1 phenylpyruvate tautomerase PptA (4-oxalocrotonate tautomerase family) [Agrobacterium radiobacter]MDR6587821.1 phenylpyruvate tautomerase PptA (4-oxalocrotonate tautomerase family) [Agrobacterium tumefaciens]
MAKALDLDKFEPKDASELYKGILQQVSAVLISHFNEVKNEIAVHIKSIAQKAWLTQAGLKNGTISREHADMAMHTQELALSSVLLYSEFLVYDTVQTVLNAVFGVIGAAIRNLTGFDLAFGRS